MFQNAQHGQSTAEYGLIIAAIAVVVMLCLSNMGRSLTHLFSQSSDALIASHSSISSNTEDNHPGSKPSATSIRDYAKEGTGYYKVVNDPDTGKPTLMHMMESSKPANTTSIDGNQFNAIGSMMIANTFRQRAEAESDPELKDYYSKLSTTAYYMGAIEGTLDGVESFSFNTYSKSAALRDFAFNKDSMEHLINNPPANLDQKTYSAVIPLAVEVFNIGQHYDLSHNYYTNADGTTHYMDPLNVNPKGFSSINQLTSFENLKALSAKVLSDNRVDSVPVEVTLTDATQIENHASSPRGSRKRD